MGLIRRVPCRLFPPSRPAGPFPFSTAKFSFRTVPRLLRNRGVVLATLGYCG